MHYTLLDCYTDEASGLGVPPYLGTYPKYLYGHLQKAGHQVRYLTIDDLRLWLRYGGIKKEPSVKEKTNILTYNLTKNQAKEALSRTEVLIIILGVQAPGKYLSALPGTLREVLSLVKDLPVRKIFTGPALSGTQLEGGKFFEKENLSQYGEVENYPFSFFEINSFVKESVGILTEIPDKRVIEIETGRGCKAGKCSFCTEPLKCAFTNRRMEDVVREVRLFYQAGARHFRLGKQADFYASDRPVEMLKEIRNKCPALEVLHIDNVNPNSVITKEGGEITRGIVEYGTPGNVAALGVESFDPEVIRANMLNTAPETALKAIRVINQFGAERGDNGLPKFLPGINLIFGLIKENKETHRKNMAALQEILRENLLLRRINIRQVSIFPGTYLEKQAGNKYLRKNRRYYWKWRHEIRQTIDHPMLERILPRGTVLSDVWTEIYDGKTTFCRQMGTYPLVIGVKGRLPLKEKIKVKVIDYMLRSVVGEVV